MNHSYQIDKDLWSRDCKIAINDDGGWPGLYPQMGLRNEQDNPF
jgi:hypothetical protein